MAIDHRTSRLDRLRAARRDAEDELLAKDSRLELIAATRAIAADGDRRNLRGIDRFREAAGEVAGARVRFSRVAAVLSKAVKRAVKRTRAGSREEAS